MDAGHLVSRQELLTRSRWQLVYRISRCTAVCCCEPEFEIAQLESRHDALDSFGTLGTRVPSPFAWGRNGVREPRAQRPGTCWAMVPVARFLRRHLFLSTTTIRVSVSVG